LRLISFRKNSRIIHILMSALLSYAAQMAPAAKVCLPPKPAIGTGVWDTRSRDQPTELSHPLTHPRPLSMLLEQLQQHHMRHTPVQHHHAFDARFHRGNRAFELGDHAAGDRAVFDQRARLGH